MTTVLNTGDAQQLFAVEVDQQPYNNCGEMEPFVALEYIVRTTDESTIAPNTLHIPWDCYTGILMYGEHTKVAQTFAELKQFLATTLDIKEDWDGPMEGTPSRLALFKSPTTGLSLIVGHGDYIDFTPEFSDFLQRTTAKDVYWISVDDDNEPLGCLAALVKDGVVMDNTAMALLEESAPSRTKVQWGIYLPHTKAIRLFA